MANALHDSTARGTARTRDWRKSMSDNVAAENPGTNFIRPCNLCPHMKRITLPKILDALVYMREEVTVDPAIADRARLAVERMVNLKH